VAGVVEDARATNWGVDNDLVRVEDVAVDLIIPLELLLLWLTCFNCGTTRSWTTTDAPTRLRAKVSGGSRSELLLLRGPC
jgi:hypothetical protein